MGVVISGSVLAALHHLAIVAITQGAFVLAVKVLTIELLSKFGKQESLRTMAAT